MIFKVFNMDIYGKQSIVYQSTRLEGYHRQSTNEPLTYKTNQYNPTQPGYLNTRGGPLPQGEITHTPSAVYLVAMFCVCDKSTWVEGIS